MPIVDWRSLYDSNRAVIEGRRGVPARPGPARPGTAPPLRGSRPVRPATNAPYSLVHSPRGVAPAVRRPLVCMLHGCTQDAASFAAATRMDDVADRHGFTVVYPQQERRENPQGCWNWFRREHQARGAGEPAAIAAIVAELIASGSGGAIDAERVYVVGLSAGGAMAAILAATYPDVFTAVAVHSGLAFGSATSVGAAFAAMARGARGAAGAGRAAHAAAGDLARPVPSIVLHGRADRTVALVNAHQVLEQSMAANRLAAGADDLEVERPSTRARGQVPGGHAFTRARWRDGRGALMHELVEVEGMGHAWSGGVAGGSFTDPHGPDASDAIWRFCAEAGAPGRLPARVSPRAAPEALPRPS